MNKAQTEAAIVTAEKEYRDKCKAHRARLLRPVLAELTRLNAASRKTKDYKVRKLRAWLDVLSVGVTPEEPDDGNRPK